MSDSERASYDAIIVGAGVIGSAMAFELAKKGWKTLNVDKLPASGYGPLLHLRRGGHGLRRVLLLEGLVELSRERG